MQVAGARPKVTVTADGGGDPDGVGVDSGVREATGLTNQQELAGQFVGKHRFRHPAWRTRRLTLLSLIENRSASSRAVSPAR